MTSKINKEEKNYLPLIITIIIFALVYFFLLSKIPWKLVFSLNLVSGGDTGSHNYLAYYATKIFPKMKWWSLDWYAGFPFLYFYPPFLYYLVAIFSKFIPWFIGLKIVTLLGTLFLPLAIYLCLKILDYKFPIPVLGSVLSLFYIFLEKFSIYGGNFPSTLAGEFSYSLGFGLFFVFIALLIKSYKNNKLWLLSSCLLSLMVIIHPFSVIVAVLVAGFLFIEYLLKKFLKKKGELDFWLLFKIYVLAFLLSAFWSLPFLMLLPYTAKMNWTKTLKLEEIFPSTLVFFEYIAFITMGWFILNSVFSKIKESQKFYIFIFVLLAALVPYCFLNNSSIWNTRFLPFILMTLLIISAIGIGNLYQFLEKEIIKIFKGKKKIIIKSVLSFCLILGIYFLIFNFLSKTIVYGTSWSKWNYEGFEGKKEWYKIKELTEYLKNLSYGRIMWEYRKEYDKFGTPRILENLPIWTNKPTFEGLLIESAISSYFHFINQAETTKTPTAAVAGFEYPPFNFENGVKHLKLFGANYFVAFTPEIKELADKYFTKLKEINEFNVYQIDNTSLIEVIPNIELRKKTKKWLDESIDWYKKMDFSKFIVFYQNQKEKRIIEEALNKKSSFINQPADIVSITQDRLVFNTPNLFYPHLVKISYFPGWKVIGAKGPFLISPSFMMVIPYQNQVILKYQYNFWDKAGMILSSLSFIYLIAMVFFRKFIDSLKKKTPFRFLSNY